MEMKSDFVADVNVNNQQFRRAGTTVTGTGTGATKPGAA
jgi:hypothetical protein